MSSTLRRFFRSPKGQTSQRQERDSDVSNLEGAPGQSLPLPLELIHKIIEEHLSEPQDSSSLRNLGATCRTMASCCRPIIFRTLTLNCNLWTRANPIFPPAALKYVQELRISIRQYHLQTKGDLAKERAEWIKALTGAPNLRVVQCTIGAQPLDPQVSAAFATLLCTLPRLETLSLQAPTKEAMHPLIKSVELAGSGTSWLPSIKNFSVVYHVDNRYSHFFAGGEGFAIELLHDEVAPGTGSLQHLQWGLWRCFGHRDQTFVNRYSQTLRCLHLGDRVLPSDPEDLSINPPTLDSLDLGSLNALEYLEVLTIYSVLHGALRWIAQSVTTLPPLTSNTGRSKLKIYLILNCNMPFLHRRDTWTPQRSKNTWQQGLRDAQFSILQERQAELDLVGFLRLHEAGRSAASALKCLGRYGVVDDSDEETRYEDFWTGCSCSGWSFRA
ncbi:hypothetical protein BKA70DRAFT_1263066 [Coprinopsis sp. MPI-PUGE-AT-0042]|nr:hypothetical protein BKA70DRAFT_1263066 [Coprinopsis sp. MPI-PUGE-AT-0042]